MDTMKQNKKRQKDNGGCGCSLGCTGCLGVIVFVFVMWALIFGFTVGGQHYGITCSFEHGVEVRTDGSSP